MPSLRRMMFSGLMSRCTMPLACAAASAPATWTATSRTSAADIGCARSRSRRVAPSMNSVAMKAVEPD